MQRLFPGVLGLILTGLMLSGCAGNASPNVAERHPIQVQSHPAILSLGEHDLSDDKAAHLDAFARDWAVQGRGPLTLAVPQGEDHQSLVDKAVAQLTQMGVPLTNLRKGSYPQGENSYKGVVAFFDRLRALAPDCSPRWAEPVYNMSNTGIPEMGCATQSNLAAMVATPSDLIAPRASTPIDHGRRMVAVESYRNGTLISNSEEQATTSTRASE